MFTSIFSHVPRVSMLEPSNKLMFIGVLTRLGLFNFFEVVARIIFRSSPMSTITCLNLLLLRCAMIKREPFFQFWSII